MSALEETPAGENLLGEMSPPPEAASGESYRGYKPSYSPRYKRSSARLRLSELGHTEPSEVAPIEVAITKASGEDLPFGPESLLRDCVEVSPSIAPAFVLWMTAAGGSRTGDRSWTFASTTGVLEIIGGVCPPKMLMSEASFRAAHVKGTARQRTMAELLKKRLGIDPKELPISYPDLSERPWQAVVLSATKTGQLNLKLATAPGGPIREGGLLHRWPLQGIIKRPASRPEEAISVAYDARKFGLEIADPDEIAAPLEAMVRSSVVLHEARGMPGLCDLTEGRHSGAPVTRRRLSCAAGMRVARQRELGGERAMIAPRVADVAGMAEAQPALDEVLLEPQKRVVGAQLAAGYGMLQTSDVGTGKTVQTLRGQRIAAKVEPGFRALVVVPSELREQWAEEAGQFFPEAQVLMPEGGRGFARDLVRFERETGERPGLIITSYEQVRSGTADLEVLTYSQVVVDEGARLANPDTQLSRALWRLRCRAAVAILLTATPIGRSLEEIDALTAYILEDERALKERRIGRAYGGFDTLSRERLREALGPLMQRVSRAELAEHLPELGEVETTRLTPGPELRKLLEATEHRIADLYAEVKERTAKAAESGSELAAEAQAELLRMRGILLGAVTTARLAKDPESLRSSRGQVAALLEADGLVAAAAKEGSPARRAVAQVIADAIRNEEQVLCFSEFTSHLELLRGELATEHGVEAGLFAGPTPKADREALKRAFRAGEVGCVLVGPMGREGVNLQPASSQALCVHYDLPWEPRAFVQRSGRGARIGSAAEQIGVIVPVLRHSIDARIAQLLLPRAAKAAEALSKDGESDPLAAQLHGLASELASDEEASTLMRVCEQVLSERAKGER